MNPKHENCTTPFQMLHFQAFTNCVHGYDRARNVRTNGIMHTQRFKHSIDSFT